MILKCLKDAAESWVAAIEIDQLCVQRCVRSYHSGCIASLCAALDYLHESLCVHLQLSFSLVD